MNTYEVRWKPSADRSVCTACEMHPQDSVRLIEIVQAVEYQLARNPLKMGKSTGGSRGVRQYVHIDDRLRYHSFLFVLDAVQKVVSILKYHYVSHLELFDPKDDEGSPRVVQDV